MSCTTHGTATAFPMCIATALHSFSNTGVFWFAAALAAVAAHLVPSFSLPLNRHFQQPFEDLCDVPHSLHTAVYNSAHAWHLPIRSLFRASILLLLGAAMQCSKLRHPHPQSPHHVLCPPPCLQHFTLSINNIKTTLLLPFRHGLVPFVYVLSWSLETSVSWLEALAVCAPAAATAIGLSGLWVVLLLQQSILYRFGNWCKHHACLPIFVADCGGLDHAVWWHMLLGAW